MKIYSHYLLYILVLFFTTMPITYAQNTDVKSTKTSKDSITSIKHHVKGTSTIIKKTAIPDSLQLPDSLLSIIHTVPRDSNGLIIVPRNNWVPFSEYTSFLDTILIEPVFLPVVFDGKLLPDNLDFMESSKDMDYGIEPFYLISPDSTFTKQLQHIDAIQNARRSYYMNNPRKIKLNALTFSGAPVIAQEVVKKKNPFQELISTEKPIGIARPDIEKIGIRQKFWIMRGEHNLQFSMNKFSEKWSGDNNYTLVNYHKFTLNYKKKRLAFNNTIEWRLNLIQTDDNNDNIIHKIRVTDDYFRTYSTVGIDAYKNWSYSANLEAKTPLFNRFNATDDNKTRAIFSPLEINSGIGMRYNIEKKSTTNKYRKFNLSTDISLLSIDYKFVGDGLIDQKQFGIEEDKKSVANYGSTFNINMSYSHNRLTSFSSRLKYFTTYDKVQIEFENTINFKLNDYFSTSLYYYLKYNDDIPVANKDDKYGYFMYNGRLAFGLSYNW